MFQYLVRHWMLTERNSRQSLVVVLPYRVSSQRPTQRPTQQTTQQTTAPMSKSKQCNQIPGKAPANPQDKQHKRQIQKKSRDRKRARYKHLEKLEELFPKLQSENRVLVETNGALKQENYDHQMALSSQNHNLRQLETDLQRAYETRDQLSMKLQSTEERCQAINASYVELQAQHGTCKEQFTKDQLRDTWRQEEIQRLQKEVNQLREREAEHQSAIASWRGVADLLKARIRHLKAPHMNVSEEPCMSSTFWDPVP
jgi:chromosome segregation ATPase